MNKFELFRQVAEAIHKLVNPSEDEIYKAVEDYLSSPYCPTCGSCGETGCCSPDRCNEVICLYGASNLKDYKELLEENEALTNQLKKAKEDSESYCCTDERDKLEEESKTKKFTWGEWSDKNPQAYDPSGYPKL